MKIAEKVVRIESDAYEYVVDFANEHDLKIGEAVIILIRFCASRLESQAGSCRGSGSAECGGR